MNAPDIKTRAARARRPRRSSSAIAKSVSPSYTRDYPLVIARGEGAIVEDVDGNRFLDCAAGIAVNSTGLSHPDVVTAIAEQAAEVHPHVGHRLLLRAAGAARRGVGAHRADRRATVRTFFGNSGTEATEAAIKLARYHTKRPGIIAFLGAFHGRSLGSLSLTASKVVQRRGFGPFMPGVYHAPYPDTVSLQRQRGSRAPTQCLSLHRGSDPVAPVAPDEVAAIVVEPIQGEGGYIVPPPGVPAGAAGAGDAARHPAGRRRSAVGHGPHGEDVRLGALRPEGRHRHHREGHRVGPAARRHLRARRRDDVAARRAREHLRRQSRRLRRRARDDQAARRTASSRTPPAWASTSSPGCASCRTSTRSSATCAARA